MDLTSRLIEHQRKQSTQGCHHKVTKRKIVTTKKNSRDENDNDSRETSTASFASLLCLGMAPLSIACSASHVSFLFFLCWFYFCWLSLSFVCLVLFLFLEESLATSIHLVNKLWFTRWESKEEEKQVVEKEKEKRQSLGSSLWASR